MTKKKTTQAPELVKHVTVDMETGVVTEEWLPKEAPEAREVKPSLQEQIDELKVRVAVLENRHG